MAPLSCDYLIYLRTGYVPILDSAHTGFFPPGAGSGFVLNWVGIGLEVARSRARLAARGASEKRSFKAHSALACFVDRAWTAVHGFPPARIEAARDFAQNWHPRGLQAAFFPLQGRGGALSVRWLLVCLVGSIPLGKVPKHASAFLRLFDLFSDRLRPHS